jgi:hypothetical protein
LAFKIIAILHNTQLATFIKLDHEAGPLLLRIRNVSDKIVYKVKTHILYAITFFEILAYCEAIKKNPVQPDGSQMAIRRMRIACWVTKATDGSFVGRVVSMLASGTQVRGFEPGRSGRIFWAKKSSACLRSEEN